MDYCNTVTSAFREFGHFTPPVCVDFATEAKAERRCQARSGELPTILRTEAARCGRKRAATLLAPEPETLEQPLPPIALYVSIYVFLGKRGIANPTIFLMHLSFPSFSYIDTLRILYVKRHVYILHMYNLIKSRIKADK